MGRSAIFSSGKEASPRFPLVLNATLVQSAKFKTEMRHTDLVAQGWCRYFFAQLIKTERDEDGAKDPRQA